LSLHGRIGPVIVARPAIRRATEKIDVSAEVGDQKAAIGIFKDIGIKFIRLALPGAAAGPVVAGNFVAVVRIRREEIAIVIDVKSDGHHQLFAVIETKRALRLALRFREHRQQQGCEDGNNGNDHQQLDQCERAPHSYTDTANGNLLQEILIHKSEFADTVPQNMFRIQP